MQGIYLEQLGLDFVKTCLELYFENIYFIGTFFIGILAFFVSKHLEKKYLSIYVIFLFATIFNPFAVKIVFGYFGMDDVYYRFFWLLPVNIITAYVFIYFINRIKNITEKFIAIIFILILILFLGNPMLEPSQFIDIPDNLYKVSDEVLEISEYIHQDCDTENPRVAPSVDLLMTLRQYDASIHLTLDRDRVLCWHGFPTFQYYAANNDNNYMIQKQMMDVLYGGYTSNLDGFLESIHNTGTQYVIFEKSVDILDSLISIGGEYVAETESYYIFEFK